MPLPPPPIAYIEAGKLHATEGNRPHGSGEEDLAGLAETIRHLGILVPLIVVEHSRRPGHYVIKEGHRRYKAGLSIGLGQFPCTLRRLTKAEQQYGTELTEIVANTQRAPWGPVEFALKLGQLRDKGMTQADIARYTGLSDQAVSYHMELLELDGETLQRVRNGQVTVGAAHEAVKTVRTAAPPPRPGPREIPPRRRPAAGERQRKPRPHFDATHRLAAAASELCTRYKHPAWNRLGKVACGHCFEEAIVNDALSQQRPPAPVPASGAAPAMFRSAIAS